MCGYVEDGDIMTMLRAVIRAGMEALRGARSAAGMICQPAPGTGVAMGAGCCYDIPASADVIAGRLTYILSHSIRPHPV